MTPEARKARADHADRLLNDDLLNKALGAIEHRAAMAFVNANSDAELRQCQALAKAAAMLPGVLRTYLNDGTVALDEIRKRKAKAA